MRTYRTTRRHGRALRPGLALVLAGAAVAACESEETVTAADAAPAPRADVTADRAAFEIARAKTEARLGLTPAGAGAVRVELVAELNRDPGTADQDVVATWEQAGGVTPQPFVVTIPAGCFVPNLAGLHVRDFRGCGVTVALGRQFPPLLDFDARMGVDPDPFAPARLDIQAVMGVQPEPFAPQLLGALGGAVVELAVGAESAGAAPLAVETVSGIEPTPF